MNKHTHTYLDLGPLTYFVSPIELFPYRCLALAQTIAMLRGSKVFTQLFRSEIQMLSQNVQRR